MIQAQNSLVSSVVLVFFGVHIQASTPADDEVPVGKAATILKRRR
jgi:hypothetical protein